ncbi:probable palmitoyltransferase ZDHHC11 [Sinocyclocheilus anshuiensis]|uniref:probable palmitoyltransferase ZDHHC11 n=1 Tax=Sinocyclocheilus anshuiensis TaxID=1608454 RepID=UPI0007B7DB0C|nr:PREDICTED: probable palmitoyltransferase ZDHHC11 [Sinocyclocheilus anshuiensis]
MTNLNCFGRHRRRTAPQSNGSRNELFAPPLHSRINGWSLPLHSLQLLAWLVYSFMAIVGFGIYVPLLPAPWSFAAYALIGTAFVLHLVTHVAAVTIDPADLSVRRRKDYSSPMPVFDNTKHQHIIHNLHCTLCEVDVGPKAKHCSTCNKCIADFDHHCKWLNNCVGGRNYRFFFITVLSAVIGMILLILVVLFVFIEHYVNPAVLRTAPQFQTVKGNDSWLVFLPAAPLETSSIGLLALAFITVLLALAALLLLCHLLCFHIYLLSQGISTYEYIVRNRQSTNPKEKEQVPPALPSNGATTQSLGPLESPVNCDAPLSSRSCTFKLEDRGQTSGRLPEPICAELEEVNGERHLEYSSESPTQMIAGEPVMSLPVGWNLSGIEKPQAPVRSVEKPAEGRPIVQDPLGSSIMDAAVVHQQLMTEAQTQYLGFKEQMP